MMPFVTEEIWRQLPLDRRVARRRSWSPRGPDAAALAEFADPGAENSIAAVHDIVVAVRAVRARYRCRPGRRSPSSSRPPGPTALLEGESGARPLARRRGYADLLADRRQAVTLGRRGAGKLEVYVPLEGLVDFDAERARLGKELEKAARTSSSSRRSFPTRASWPRRHPRSSRRTARAAAELTDALATLEVQLAELA